MGILGDMIQDFELSVGTYSKARREHLIAGKGHCLRRFLVFSIPYEAVCGSVPHLDHYSLNPIVIAFLYSSLLEAKSQSQPIQL